MSNSELRSLIEEAAALLRNATYDGSIHTQDAEVWFDRYGWVMRRLDAHTADSATPAKETT